MAQKRKVEVMKMINRVVLVGRITKDPVLRKTQSGLSTVSFVLACNRRKTSDGKQEADFINCVAWRQSADFMANYVKKGVLLGIEGRIQTRFYDDKDNKRVYVTEVVADSVQILESKSNHTPESNNAQQYVPPVQDLSYDPVCIDQSLDINPDDLPF